MENTTGHKERVEINQKQPKGLTYSDQKSTKGKKTPNLANVTPDPKPRIKSRRGDKNLPFRTSTDLAGLSEHKGSSIVNHYRQKRKKMGNHKLRTPLTDRKSISRKSANHEKSLELPRGAEGILMTPKTTKSAQKPTPKNTSFESKKKRFYVMTGTQKFLKAYLEESAGLQSPSQSSYQSSSKFYKTRQPPVYRHIRRENERRRKIHQLLSKTANDYVSQKQKMTQIDGLKTAVFFEGNEDDDQPEDILGTSADRNKLAECLKMSKMIHIKQLSQLRRKMIKICSESSKPVKRLSKQSKDIPVDVSAQQNYLEKLRNLINSRKSTRKQRTKAVRKNTKIEDHDKKLVENHLQSDSGTLITSPLITQTPNPGYLHNNKIKKKFLKKIEMEQYTHNPSLEGYPINEESCIQSKADTFAYWNAKKKLNRNSSDFQGGMFRNEGYFKKIEKVPNLFDMYKKQDIYEQMRIEQDVRDSKIIVRSLKARKRRLNKFARGYLDRFKYSDYKKLGANSPQKFRYQLFGGEELKKRDVERAKRYGLEGYKRPFGGKKRVASGGGVAGSRLRKRSLDAAWRAGRGVSISGLRVDEKESGKEWLDGMFQTSWTVKRAKSSQARVEGRKVKGDGLKKMPSFFSRKRGRLNVGGSVKGKRVTAPEAGSGGKKRVVGNITKRAKSRGGKADGGRLDSNFYTDVV